MVFPLPAPPSYSVDLFLIGSNPESIAEVGWLDPKRAEEDNAFQAAVRRTLDPWLRVQRPFILMDGGDGGIFSTAKPSNTMRYLAREYGGCDSMAETVNGKTRVLAHTNTENTSSGIMTVGRNEPSRSIARSFIHFGMEPNHPVVALMDLSSFRETTTRGQPSDKTSLPFSILLSDDSPFQTQDYLSRTGIRPPGPVLCRTGIPRARDRGIYCFPPQGVIGHYRLIQGDPGWRLEFVEFVRTTP